MVKVRSIDHRSILPEVIGAVGAGNFAAVAAGAVGRYLGFDLAAIVIHRPAGRPAVMFDNFDSIGCRRGLENYVHYTHSINPMLVRAPAVGARRARDFAVSSLEMSEGMHDHLMLAPDEEIGFRTVGWPRWMEEVGLYIHACGGVVELSFFRERSRRAAAGSKLRAMNDLVAPMAAAFERHSTLLALTLPGAASVLSPRERQVCELLLAGCSSQAIALRLNMSRYTVKDHRKHIFRKLGVGSLAGLFALHRAPPPWRDG